ncbi:hypothetical protein [Maridesulfovibrio ferrireducens]|uniref:hypothetical protein n=1 Tax=Maridesulfovibrio ferrireducens TaxID=246191 RepID=UPI001A1FD9A6|nr:hypothetical protein [Maridesulfovibrio ferrireducens]MBI9112942.1 hypothetical protein [Maridesulfovibrio ferrireducens]
MTLLFDDAKKLEKALGAEAAEVIAHVFEKQDAEYKKELATKHDIELVRKDILESESRVKADIIKWMAGLLVVQAASIAALVKLL